MVFNQPWSHSALLVPPLRVMRNLLSALVVSSPFPLLLPGISGSHPGQTQGRLKAMERLSCIHVQLDGAKLGSSWVDTSQSRCCVVLLMILTSSGHAQQGHGPAMLVPRRQGLPLAGSPSGQSWPAPAFYWRRTFPTSAAGAPELPKAPAVTPHRTQHSSTPTQDVIHLTS